LEHQLGVINQILSHLLIFNNTIMVATNFQSSVIDMAVNLHPYAINLTKDMDEAKDLLQETIFRALSNADKYTQGTNLKAWLFTIMRNIFINSYRKKMKRNTIIDNTDNLYYINSKQSITSNRAEGNFMIQDIKNGIARLSDDYKVPFMMHFEGHKYQEIADHLHLPLGTVKSRIFFARKELKKRLAVYNFSSN